MVSVPVLSEQIQEVEPRVSTASRVLTSTFLSANFLAVMAKDIVTQAKIPSGTFATIMPIPKTIQSRREQPTTHLLSTINNVPRTPAMIVIISTKRSSSTCKGDFYFLLPSDRSATLPMQVAPPISTTIPLPRPCLQQVPKKAILLLSSILSLFPSTVLRRRFVSPVSDELSTFMLRDCTILKSAGIFSPFSISTKSPLTNQTAGRLRVLPSLMTLQLAGNIYLNCSIRASDLADCRQVMAPVIRITPIRAPARQRFASLPAGAKMQMRMDRKAPTQSSMANQLVISFKKRITGWVFSFSGNLFSPSSSERSAAQDWVNPDFKSVFSKAHKWSSEI